jgi:hypothetical protein
MDRRFWRFAAIAAVGAMLVPTGLLNHPGHAQSSETRPQFEVASIKPTAGFHDSFNTTPATVRRMVRKAGHGRLTLHWATLKDLIVAAYNVTNDFQIVGGPAWANDDQYEVIAKAEGNATSGQMRPMLQSLLADRFKLTIHRETQEMPIYRLAVAKAARRLRRRKRGVASTSIRMFVCPWGPKSAADSGGDFTNLQLMR